MSSAFFDFEARYLRAFTLKTRPKKLPLTISQTFEKIRRKVIKRKKTENSETF